jgi:hypothetical protein
MRFVQNQKCLHLLLNQNLLFAKMKKIHIVLLFYTVLFLLVGLFTLNLNYVEGDDASTILYHLCGRNAEVQKPYGAYNSGLDYLLQVSGLTEESSLRSFAVLASFISGWLVLCFSAIFINLFFENKSEKARFGFLLLLPFIIPDFIFHSLIINATNISFAFAMPGVIFYLLYLRKNQWKHFILSVIFMAVAIPFRWSILTIFPLFYGLLLMCGNGEAFLRKLIFTALHSAITLILGIVLIGVSGYDFESVYNIIIWGSNSVENFELSVLSVFATLSPFLTASFVVLLVFGLWAGIYKKNKLEILRNGAFIFLSALPYFILGFFPSFKFLMTMMPMLLVVAAMGYFFLSEFKYLKAALMLAIFLPWIIGIKVNATGTTAGPGFEQSIAGKIQQNATINEKNTDARIKINSVSPYFGGGFYMPTLEGPRPLFGYFAVIFSGWKNNIQAFTDEREMAISLMKKDKSYIYLQDRRTSYMQCDFFKHGYKTSTDFMLDEKRQLEYRDFSNAHDTIRMYVIPDNVSKIDVAKTFLAEKHKVIFRSSYSSIILGLVQENDGYRLLGPFTVVKE